jgi:hypothetical protein
MNKRNKLVALLGAGLLTFAVAGVALAASHTWDVSVQGQHQGWPNDTCSTDEGSLPATMLWVWTGESPSDLTINGNLQSGSWVQQGGGSSAYHFTVDVDGDNYPPTTASVTYSGADGTLTLSHCDGAAPTPTPTPTLPGGGGAGDTDQPPTDTAIGTTGSSGPTDTAWLLVVGLGVLLASIVVLTPARAKTRR